ncbi:TPM domain-containing protein [Christensenellaceae bacterium OttesenSCG-928-K19]|nr:TPM domain-containing protein [Christensenellaceae bacterium OttesenSCG-928-K19]
MKKMISTVFVLILLLLFAVPVFAASAGERVFDNAQLFTAEEREALQSMIDAHVDEYDMDVVVLTISDNEGKSTRAYADDFYDDYGFGYGDDDAGVLFLIDMDSREIYISTAGRMIDILNDARIEELLDIQYEYVSMGKYYDAMDAAIVQTAAFIDAGPVPGQYRRDEGRYLEPWWIAVSIAIGVGTAAIVVAVINSRYKKEFKPVPYDFKNESKLSLSLKTDDFINKHVDRRYNPPPPTNSGGGSFGGGSTTHTSSSGSSHGGGGRSF